MLDGLEGLGGGTANKEVPSTLVGAEVPALLPEPWLDTTANTPKTSTEAGGNTHHQ